MAKNTEETRHYLEIAPRNLEKRYLAFGRAVMKRFTLEMNEGGEMLSYDRVTDADVLQLTAPAPLFPVERWQVTVARYGPEVFVEQLYYSQAGKAWMTGVSFHFDQEVLADRLGINDVWSANDHLGLLEDDGLFTGICEAIEQWEASGERVSPIEEDLENLDLV